MQNPLSCPKTTSFSPQLAGSVARVFVQRPHVAITGLASLTVRSQQGAESHAHTEVEARGWDTKRRELFNGYRVSILGEESVLELHGGVVAQQCECYLKPLNGTVKYA